ncbi:DUF72 domain-containing protein [Pseudomonas marincola]|uniref:DUF72 domain-containing protein n=1 Tax=Pseudomonas marincola TaxID=437900 RepID=UPI0008EA5AB2|nr:DUF72 domain-containing protein [Pseudomonas marincola]SFT51906.1 Uncharacterized conserved protein YecE, DUF72 family [Pseudomonas marincola]
MIPYYLGCPSWSENAWRGLVYPDEARSTDFLGHYCQLFNTVEGNTTFYARPSQATIARWAETMPGSFRFCAKLPGDISHSGDLRLQFEAVDQFRQLLAPLGPRVTPYWLQLPASFEPRRLPELASFIDHWGEGALAVEVRHPHFFAKGEEEKALNRLLLDRGVERICLDSRALFSCTSADASVVHAQDKKPRLPIRPAAFSQAPQVRFIGHPQLLANDPFIEPWLDKVAQWIEAGLTPHVYLHTSDNRLAPLLARRFHEQLMTRLPGLPALPAIDIAPPAEQLGLL